MLLTTMIFVYYVLVAVTLSGILKAKQKLGVSFNSGKLGGIDFTKILELIMCSVCKEAVDFSKNLVCKV